MDRNDKTKDVPHIENKGLVVVEADIIDRETNDTDEVTEIPP